MRKLFFLFIISFLTTIFVVIDANSAFADANDFYFGSATFDYYLQKQDNGASYMRVEEELTAVFPSYNQNHGIERCIPKKYNGTSIITNKNFKVLRNGKEEPFNTYSDNGFMCLRIGSADSYVLGEQQYQIKYELENVILQPRNARGQELYWDVNGTGWAQPFTTVTARVHLPQSLNSARISQLESDLSCYTGAYGTSGPGDCVITTETSIDQENATVLVFVTYNLGPYETLTINIPFKDNTFFIKSPDPNYLLFAIVAAIITATIFAVRKLVRDYRAIKDKITLAKDKVVPVQYIPPNGLTVAEASEVWLKASRSSQVATLIELAVSHKIELEKGKKKTFGGYNWIIHVKNLDNNTEHQNIVLRILNGGAAPEPGDTIEVKRRSSTNTLISLGNQYPKKIENRLKQHQLLENTKTSSNSVITIILVIFSMAFAIPLLAFAMETIEDSGTPPVVMIATLLYCFAALCGFSITFSIFHKYKIRTKKGIEISKYLDGLKEYMNLAEKDRLAFLQSVEGVDTSHNGIARLYERLLPYAIIFGIEDSWFGELNKYYEMEDVTSADWVTGAAIISASDFRSFSSYTSSSISSSTASSDSDGSSGGGGGGFSGGGGGGGGGGGW